MVSWTEHIDCEQNSPEWYAARLGRPTASEFSTIRTAGSGKTRRDYLLKLAGERLTGEPMQRVNVPAMQRGHDLEGEAATEYEFITDEVTQPVGFIVNHQSDCGASPDRLVGDAGLAEVKSKAPHLQLAVLNDDAVPGEHMDQIQGQLWVAEREWCDFVSYCPGLPIFVRRVYRDEAYIEQLRRDVERFFDELLAFESRIRNRYRI